MYMYVYTHIHISMHIEKNIQQMHSAKTIPTKFSELS